MSDDKKELEEKLEESTNNANGTNEITLAFNAVYSTMLQSAVAGKSINIIQELIDNGADVNQVRDHNLLQCCWDEIGFDILKLLVKNGFKIPDSLTAHYNNVYVNKMPKETVHFLKLCRKAEKGDKMAEGLIKILLKDV